MKERPILFSGPMVRAILDGRKTQTRRIVKNINPTLIESGASASQIANALTCPYGSPGDRLWVRESFSSWHHGYHWYECTREGRSPASASNVFYRETHHFPDDDQKWVPSIFMPRWASRIMLEVTDIRAERLHEITEDDVRAEGVFPYMIADASPPTMTGQFRLLWEQINGTGSWDVNPWVWVISFKRI